MKIPATKWALVMVVATSAFLSGLALPTTARDPLAPTWISPLPGERPLLTPFTPHVKRGRNSLPAKSLPTHIPTHMGVDLSATFGEEIRAPIGGVISFSGVVNQIPIVVLTHHDQLTLRRTTYLPATTDLPVGYTVLQGDLFARVAPLFHCARPCLHWGERIGGRYANPMKHLGRAILLPRLT